MSDNLTHLPCRQEFTQELKTILHDARQSGATLALLIIKLLHLTEINTVFGYRSGDAMLSETASRITSMLREKDVLYRIGDNSFALILPTLQNESIARLAVNKLLTLFDQPFDTEGHHLKGNVKIGIALSPQHTQDADHLSQYADIALESALSGTEAYQFFQPGQLETGSRSIAIEQDMHHALENDELILLYQPQIDLRTLTLCGMEALIRWQSPSRGFVPPDLFIPLIEKSNLILPLTLWTFNTAMRQCNWLAANHLDIPVSINLSAAVLNTPNLVEHVTNAMKLWDIPPGKLLLELTESAFMEDPEKSLGTLHSLHEKGILLSIDDFGTGFSSMSYLSRLPVNELKIDKSFVMNMTQSNSDLKIVRSVIELAHNFDLTVIAEGVEDEAALEKLISLGCDRGQGYYFGCPMSAADLLNFAINSES